MEFQYIVIKVIRQFNSLLANTKIKWAMACEILTVNIKQKKRMKKKQFFFIKFKKSNSSRVKRWMLCFFQANKNSIKAEQRNQFDWESKWIDLVELIWWKPWKRRWTLRTITLSMLHNTITTLLIERCDLKNEVRWQQHRKNTFPICFGDARACFSEKMEHVRKACDHC